MMTTDSTTRQTDRWLDVASRIGHRLCDQARWQDDRCGWRIRTSKKSFDDRGSEWQPASGTLYQGTSGIALFLAELALRIDDPAIDRTALGALHHALDWSRDLPPAMESLHGGRVGNAWVTCRVAELLDRPELTRKAVELLEPLFDHDIDDDAFDVIAGAAGAIPALLDLGRHLPSEAERLLAHAARLGEHLIDSASRTPDGWSWNTVGDCAARYLCGYAHGTAGIGLALLELHRATGNGRFRFAADMAFLYERRHFDGGTSNWPDLRHKELSDLIFFGAPGQLKAANEAGTIPPFAPTYMTAWCHGSPGIGLSRLRAFEITGEAAFRDEAAAALASTLPTLEATAHDNFSLCHGLGGNAELPMISAEILDRPELLEVCDSIADYGASRYEEAGVEWPCGTADRRADPSLLLGEAGIGLFYLRLVDPAIPTPLLLRPAQPSAGAPASLGRDEAYLTIAEDWARSAFGRSLDVAQALELLDRLPAVVDPRSAPVLTPVELAHDAVQTARASAEGRPLELLDDAAQLELTSHQLLTTAIDFTDQYLRALRRPKVDDLDLESARFVLPAASRLIVEQWQLVDGADPTDSNQAYLVTRRRDRVSTQALSPFAAAVLTPLSEHADAAGRTIDDLSLDIAQLLGGDVSGVTTSDVRSKVEAQVRELYRAGFVELSDQADSATDSPSTGHIEQAERSAAATQGIPA